MKFPYLKTVKSKLFDKIITNTSQEFLNVCQREREGLRVFNISQGKTNGQWIFTVAERKSEKETSHNARSMWDVPF